jgi:hypothetical protein
VNSTEKLLLFLEQLDERPDSELAQIVPVPPSIARMAIAAASGRVPQDAAQLDEWALQAAQFCLAARSDSAQAYELAPLTMTVVERDELAAAAASDHEYGEALHDGSRTYVPPAP